MFKKKKEKNLCELGHNGPCCQKYSVVKNADGIKAQKQISYWRVFF